MRGTPPRLLAMLALALALALALLLLPAVALRVPWTAGPYRHALCLCPLCVVTDGLIEVSWNEYC